MDQIAKWKEKEKKIHEFKVSHAFLKKKHEEKDDDATHGGSGTLGGDTSSEEDSGSENVGELHVWYLGVFVLL